MKTTGESVSETGNFLKGTILFSGIKESTIIEFASKGRQGHYQKGGYVFMQSDASEDFYIVREGRVSILLGSPDGRDLVINEMKCGDCFGELGLITHKGRSTSAVAKTECDLLIFPRSVFLEALDKEPALTRRILDHTANQLRNSTEREGALAFLDAQARLVRLLLQLDKQESVKGYVTISQDELAQRTGLTRQTVAKMLGRWRRAGWLITGRGRIMLLGRAEFSQFEKEWLVS